MALDPSIWGPAIAQKLAAWASVNVPQDAFITPGKLEEAWVVITTEDKTHINENADIMLDTADIPVLPGTFQEQLPTTGPIIGVGINQAITLEQKIK